MSARTASELTDAEIGQFFDAGAPFIVPEENEDQPVRSRFTIYSVEELRSLPDPEWLVGGMLPAGGMGELVGRPGVGKTFLALDLGLRTATADEAAEWFGRPLRGGRVLYVSAEGQTFFRHRVDACLASMNLTTAPDFLTMLDAVNLVDAVNEVPAFLSAITPHGPQLALLILDTRQRCTAGSRENDSEDQGIAIASIDRIRRELGCAVLTLHHPNALGQKPRGWTGWEGALDAILTLEDDGDALVLKSSKVKDGPLMEPIRLRLAPYQASAVVVAAEEGTGPSRLTEKALHTLRTLQEIALSDGVSSSEWERACGHAHNTFFRHRKQLITTKLVADIGRKRYVVNSEGRDLLDRKFHGSTTGVPSHSPEGSTNQYRGTIVPGGGNTGVPLGDEA